MKDSHALITTGLSDSDLARVRERLADDLARVTDRLRELVTPRDNRINDPVMYSVAHTGRLLRPTLVLLSSYLFEGEPGQATGQHVIDAAATVEILHIATLYHDDLIDEAEIRRGVPTANAKYGDAIALLTGDYLLASCMLAAARLGVPHLRLMAETLVDICVGQTIETSQLFDPLRTEQDYLAAVSGKTARLMRACTAMGALQCGADPETREALESFGHNLGMAFQIWDDILDLSTTDTGKQTAKDLFNGVYTLPVIYAIKDYPDRLLPALEQQPLTAEQCAEILTVMHECGAMGRATEMAARHVSAAVSAIQDNQLLAERAPAVVRYLFDLVGRLAAVSDPGRTR